MSQIDVADKIGMARRMYQRYETGEHSLDRMKYGQLKKLAEVLNTTIEELIK
jgi:transcriptional regulator with XRE-family HTH domain